MNEKFYKCWPSIKKMDDVFVDETIIANAPATFQGTKSCDNSFDNANSSIISLANDPLNCSDPFNINKKIEEVIELLDDSSWESDHNNTESPKEGKQNILSGVCAYVEVRSGQENRSGSIEIQLKKLGATVCSKFTNDVTHVIFREGKKTTFDRATKRNIKLVSVLWVENCRISRSKVSEDKFPALVTQAPHLKQSPFLINSKQKTVRKLRSMQPRDFEQQFSNSSKKIQGILGRAGLKHLSQNSPTPHDPTKMALFSKNQMSLNSDSKKKFLDTPKSSPKFTNNFFSSVNKLNLGVAKSSSPILNKPTVATNLKDAKSKLSDLYFSKTVPAKSNFFQPQKKSSIKNHAIKLLNMPHMDVKKDGNKSIDFLTKQLKELSAGIEENNVAIDMRTGKDDPNISGISLIVPDDNEKNEVQVPDKDEAKPEIEPSAKAITQSHPNQVNADDINTKLFQRLTACKDVKSPVCKSNLLLESILKPSTDVLYRNKRINQLELATCNDSNFTDSSPEFLCQVLSSTPNSKKAIGGQKITINVTPKSKKRISLSSTSGKRLTKQSPVGISKKKRKLSVHSSPGSSKIINVVRKCEDDPLTGCEKLEQILKPRQSIFEFKSVSSDDKANKTKNHHRIGSSRIRMDGSANLPTIVSTSLRSEDRDLLVSAVKAFGGYKLSKDVKSNTSHVVCGEKRRTLSLLKAIAQGCWILSIQWVIKSIEAQKWMDEEPYECADYFPAIRISRVNKKKSHGGYSPDIFSSIGPIFISSNVSLCHSELQNLVICCQGQVTGCHRKAALSVGRYFKELPSVSEKWIFDSITEHKVMDYSDYSLSMSI